MIRDLLTSSQRFHTLAKRARREGRVDDHFAAILHAQTARRDAHAIDPDHLDQAWREDANQGNAHLDLLLFYTAELAKDLATERIAANARLADMQRVVDDSLKTLKTHPPRPVTH